MGLSKMQGTSDFIEYIGDRSSIKRHSWRGCSFYFDGVCKKKNISLDGYTDNNARYCDSYKQETLIEESQKTEGKTKKSTNKCLQCGYNKEGFCSVRKVWCHSIYELCDITKKTKIYYGDIVTIVEITKIIKHTFSIYIDPKSVVEKRNQQLFSHKHLNESIQHNGKTYKVIEIEGK